MTNIQPIPLTTKRLKELSPMKNTNQQQVDKSANQEDDDDESGLQIATTFGSENDDEADGDNIGSSDDKNKVGLRII
jgi:hypothetical protein